MSAPAGDRSRSGGRARGTASGARAQTAHERTGRSSASATAYQKVSVTLPADLLDRVRERAGPGGLSGYLADALAEKERLAALDDFLSYADEKFGPPSEEALEEVRRKWPEARGVL